MCEERCVMCGDIIPEGIMVCDRCDNTEPNFNTIKATIYLDKIDDISEFITLASKCKDDVVAKSGNFAVNAKSLMGLYSLDLSKPLRVEFYGDIPQDVRNGIRKFIVD